ncbi:homocysteine S-methyltransferase family protein [Pontiella sulfatireligans]|uniref:Hcy-binding domain-containing protein n=1 Tax=Pontiella sulfatireligans TaxID=2750658 RepID=A0A6C2UN58_9BACT|nr:homocysteine S-methyltransferase family protein [Pontiella sulfatireligans]VGO21373.1 hypothetical protein SCARR_03445 [Pontiella sulfatireligans]
MTFEKTIQTRPLMLMEAAIVERLRRNPEVRLHPRLENAMLIYSPEGRAALDSIYREYIEEAQQAALPIALSTTTWRANQARLAEANIETDVNADAVRFLKSYAGVFVGGMIGCRNDCYRPDEALSRAEAVDFHSWQINRLLDADFLYAVTLPEINEALGIAQAMAATERPYIISFVIDQTGKILDGTTLETAIERIDAETERPPLGYGVNCSYPSFLQAAKLSASATSRLISLQANASSLSHDELDQSEDIHNDDLEDWGERMIERRHTLGLKLLGGCCGTDASYLKYITQHR